MRGTWPDTTAAERQPNDGKNDEGHDVRCQQQDSLCLELCVVITEDHAFDLLCGKEAILVYIGVAG